MSVEIVHLTPNQQNRYKFSRRSQSAPVQKASNNGKNHHENGRKTLRLPCKNIIQDKNMQRAKIISTSQYEYLRSCVSRGLASEEEKKAQLMEIEAKKDQLFAESMARKQRMRQMDLEKLKNQAGKSDEFDNDTKARTVDLLERAYKLKLEQEEEMQLCNKLILETKCRAIRDLQVAEKKLLQKELTKREQELDKMMEEESLRKIQEERRKEDEEAAKRRAFGNSLKDQIIENEERRIIEFERKQEEGKLINLNNIAWQNEEIEREKRKKEREAQIQKEFISKNEQLIKFKKLEREKNKIIDLRIKEYQKMKLEREEAMRKAQETIQAQKDKERMRVMAQTMQAQDFQAQIEELNALRVKEEVEREWRRKEKEHALNKLKNQREFAREREEHMNICKIRQAMEIEREKREFERILAIQKKALLQEKDNNERRRLNAAKHRDEILKQVSDKHKEKMEARRKMFEEGMALRAEEEMRIKRLKDAIDKKCQEMRENKVPEIYINEVKNMIDKLH